MVQEIATALTSLAMTVVVVAWFRFYGKDRLQQVIPHPLSQQADSSPMLRTGEPCLPFRRECGDYPKMYRGTARRPFPTLECKKPPFPEKRGFFQTNCSTRYAERRMSDSYNAGPHEFGSSFDKQNVGQFGPPALPEKIPRFQEIGGFSIQIVRPNTPSGC